MPYIPPEVVAQAREMDLLTYLRTYEPQELVHFGGGTYCTREHDSLKISNGKWCWFSRGIGGYSALDYLIKVKEMPFTQAVETIIGNLSAAPPAFAPAPKAPKEKVLLLPQTNRSATHTKRADAAVDTEKLALIEKRHTDKSAYKNDPIDPIVADQLLGKYPALSLYQNDTAYFSYLKQLSENAVTAQSENQDYRDELAEWMRFSDQEAADKRDGLSADMLGLKGMIKSFYSWTTTRETAKGDGFAQQGIDTARKQLNGCGAFAVFTGGNTFEELVDIGRSVQAFWLDCASHEIAVQPFSAALETTPFCDTIQDDLGADAPIQMILRLGYVEDYGTNCALRRNLSDYVEVFR